MGQLIAKTRENTKCETSRPSLLLPGRGPSLHDGLFTFHTRCFAFDTMMLLTSLLLSTVWASALGKGFYSPSRGLRKLTSHPRPALDYLVYYVDSAIDHTSFSEETSLGTYRQKILVNDTYFNPAIGPILFYTGGEGPIEAFAHSAGFVMQAARDLKGLVVFAEHRYFGESFPFPADKTIEPDPGSPRKLAFLTVEQTLADFIENIDWARDKFGATPRTAVVAIGGSYGGMLSAWLRLRYPWVVDGAIASSAPLNGYPGYSSADEDIYARYSEIATRDYKTHWCADQIVDSWTALDKVAKIDNTDDDFDDNDGNLVKTTEDSPLLNRGGPRRKLSRFGGAQLGRRQKGFTSAAIPAVQNKKSHHDHGHQSHDHHSRHDKRHKRDTDSEDDRKNHPNKPRPGPEYGRDDLKGIFRLCRHVETLSDVDTLRAWLIEGLYTAAQYDYPYAVPPLPADPTKEICHAFKQSDAHSEDPRYRLQQMSDAIGIVYNNSGQAGSCYDVLDDTKMTDYSDLAWDYLQCTELMTPMISRGGHDDAFPEESFSLDDFEDYCRRRWGVTPNRRWTKSFVDSFYGGTNIVFTNGGRDPWGGAGFTRPLGPTLDVLFFPEGAHHLDLRADHPDDPYSVRNVRDAEISFIRRWMRDRAINGGETRGGQPPGPWIGPVGLLFIGSILGVFFTFAAVITGNWCFGGEFSALIPNIELWRTDQAGPLGRQVRGLEPSLVNLEDHRQPLLANGTTDYDQEA